MYAIVKTGGKQYTVKPGDVLDVEKIEGEAGDKVALDVLFVNDGKNIITDAKALASTPVKAQILDQHKGEKKLIFKFKKRKGYKRTRGHRQELTRICIVDVNGEKADAPAPKPKAQKVEEQPKATKKTAPKKTAPKKEQAKKAEPEEELVDVELSVDFNSMTVAELKDYAKKHDIKLPSGARKAEIVETILNAEQ